MVLVSLPLLAVVCGVSLVSLVLISTSTEGHILVLWQSVTLQESSPGCNLGGEEKLLSWENPKLDSMS